MLLEVGYVGNYAKKLYQGYSLQQVPYMHTLGGQTFAKAFSNIAQTMGANATAVVNGTFNPSGIPNQPYLEALGAATGQCAAGTCTQFFINNFSDGQTGFLYYNLTDFWESFRPGTGAPDMNQVLEWYIIGRHGRSKYNAGFLSLHPAPKGELTFHFNYTFPQRFDHDSPNQ